MRQVRGILFLDYVRMLRRSGSPNLARHLRPEELALLTQRIDLGAWYPMETFERLGLAILSEVVGGEVDAVRLWGRSQIPQILGFFPELRAEGDARDTLIRFNNLMGSLFDFPAVELEEINDEAASLRIAYGMGPAAEEAASWQTFGFYEALAEAAGAEQVRGRFTRMSWKTPGGPTTLALEWTPAAPRPPAAQTAGRPRLLLVDHAHLVRARLETLLEPIAQVTGATDVPEALHALETAGFDVVVADHDLGPGPTGLDLLRQVAQRWPRCGRVLHAAAPPPEARAALAEGVVHAVAQRPVSAGELKRLVAGLLQR
jgi:CheY-like chemotaxis protein